jgi:hypothetical protein
VKTYYMITTNLTFFVNIQEEGKIPFIQSIAETLMTYRGFGCTEYCFDDIDPKKAFNIDLTPYYNDYYDKWYKHLVDK